MKIVSALKSVSGLRLSSGNGRWLYFDTGTAEWVVRDHKYRARNTIEVYRGNIEDEAITVLIKEE